MQTLTCPECAGAGVIYRMGVARATCPTCMGVGYTGRILEPCETLTTEPVKLSDDSVVHVSQEVTAPDSDLGKVRTGRPRGRAKKIK